MFQYIQYSTNTRNCNQIELFDFNDLHIKAKLRSSYSFLSELIFAIARTKQDDLLFVFNLNLKSYDGYSKEEKQKKVLHSLL